MKYLIKIRIQAGGYEKMSHYVTEAPTLGAAIRKAFEAEAHSPSTLEYEGSHTAQEMGYEFVYHVSSIHILSDAEYEVLNRYL